MLRYILFLWSIASAIQCATLTVLNSTRSAAVPTVTPIDSRVVTSGNSQADTITTSIETCKPQCNVTMSIPIGLYTWWPYISFSKTITAATVVVLVNTARNTTVTSTLFNELPSGYTLPPRNAAGTQIQTVYYNRSGTQLSTEVAFPSAFLVLPDYYSWRGILETSGTCETVSTGWSIVPFTTSFQKTPTLRPTADLEGLGYWPSFSGMIGLGDYQPSEMAWQHCISTPPIGPLIPKMTARFMTDTVTQFEAVTTPSVPIETPKVPDSSNVVGSQPGTSKAQSASKVQITSVSSDNTPHTPRSQSSLVPERSKAPLASEAQSVSKVQKPSDLTENTPDTPRSQSNRGPDGSKTPLAFKPTSILRTPDSPLHTEHTQGLERPEDPVAQQHELTLTAIHARPTSMPSIIIGSSTVLLSFSPSQTGLILPNGETLLPASTTKVDGRTYSLAPSGGIAVIDGNTISLPTLAGLHAITAGSSAFSIIPVTVPGSAIVLPGDITMYPGSVATIDGTIISLEPSGSAIVVGGSTILLPLTHSPNDPAVTQGNGLESSAVIKQSLKALKTAFTVNETVQPTSGYKVPDTGNSLVSSDASKSSTGTSLEGDVEPSTPPKTTGNSGSRLHLPTWTIFMYSSLCCIIIPL